MLLRLLVLVAVLGQGLAIVDYCLENTYEEEIGPWLQFTKEPSSAEFAVEGNFKGLHCCAKGYRSIEWYKDGKPYPWSSEFSHFILYPESTNQTVYTQKVSASDQGNYTCVMRNDTHFFSHTIDLIVYEKIPDLPKITFLPNDIDVELGHPARLFCEAFVGKVHLPDAHYDVVWKRRLSNEKMGAAPRVQQEKVVREEDQTQGAYLIIKEVTEEDYGGYVCIISKPDNKREIPVFIRQRIPVVLYDQNPLPWSKLLPIFGLLIVIAISLVVFNRLYNLRLRLTLKDRCAPLETNDGKQYDALICYSSRDSEVVLGFLLPMLENSFKYMCNSKELPNNISRWSTDIMQAVQKCRRAIVVISPASFGGRWDADTVYQGLKQLQGLCIHLAIIALKEMPVSQQQLKNGQGETLAKLLKTMRVITWSRKEEANFWLAVRLFMPPNRVAHRHDTTNGGRTDTRLNNDTSNIQTISSEDMV